MKRTPVIAAAVTLVSAAVIVYHNALSAYFFDDDFQWLVGSWSFHPSQLVAFGTLSHFYRPVIDLYFAAATPLFRGSPVLFHLASVLLHAANALQKLRRVAGALYDRSARRAERDRLHRRAVCRKA